MIPTTKENMARITAMFYSIEKTVIYLADRWQDEKEYENIADYGEVIKKELPEGFTFLKMNKRPFGFDFTIGTDAVFAVCVSGSRYYLKRMK
jgi:hypothetical protein